MKTINDAVQRKCNDGTLRQALSRSTLSITQQESIIRQALDNKRLKGRAVASGKLRDALQRANWTEAEINHLIYRDE